LVAWCLAACSPAPAPEPKWDVTGALGGTADPGFARAKEPRPLRFPEDHGPHPHFRNEWWYITGNLETGEHRRFGFQITFFRVALSPDELERPSAWAANQVWMAHFALSDELSQRHIARERFARGALGLAGARAVPFEVWLENWSLRESPRGFPWVLTIDEPDLRLRLQLEPLKPIILNGEKGLSRKSATPGNASYYYSLSRLASHGRIVLDEIEHEVRGLSWMDREWSTSALDADQVGWDWFSLHLADGRDLMWYQIRDENGRASPYSSGTLVAPNGDSRPLLRDDVRLRPTGWWEGPEGRRYPVEWELTLLPMNEHIEVRSAFPDQLMDLSVRYWEGAVDVRDATTGQPKGRGYLELTGY